MLTIKRLFDIWQLCFESQVFNQNIGDSRTIVDTPGVHRLALDANMVCCMKYTEKSDAMKFSFFPIPYLK